MLGHESQTDQIEFDILGFDYIALMGDCVFDFFYGFGVEVVVQVVVTNEFELEA